MHHDGHCGCGHDHSHTHTHDCGCGHEHGPAQGELTLPSLVVMANFVD